MKFVGIDLAWSARNPSGAAVIDDGGRFIRASGDLGTIDDLCEFGGLDEHTETVVSVDAPLIVNNPSGQRPVENELGKMFSAYDAGPFPANFSLRNFQEGGRIRQLVNRLENLGFIHLPGYSGQRPQRIMVEVFLNPAQVILFPCQSRKGHSHCRALRFKHKPKRSWAEIHSEWEIYRARLRSLEYMKPAVTFSPDARQAINVDITACTGDRYKYFDDLLDGIFCAYLAYFFSRMGEKSYRVLGDTKTGYIVLPKCQLPGCTLPEELTRYPAKPS